MKIDQKFVVIDGMENTGKTKIIKRLFNGDDFCIRTREPVNYFREFLTTQNYNPDVFSEMLAFMSSKSYNLHSNIIPTLKSGGNVYCDRFFAVTLVYQCYCKGVDESFVNMIYNKMFEGNEDVRPTHEIILIGDPEILLSRTKKDEKECRFENEGVDFHWKVYEGFQKYYAENDSDVYLIDTTHLTLDETYEEVLKIIN